jgi:hypothetical protein
MPSCSSRAGCVAVAQLLLEVVVVMVVRQGTGLLLVGREQQPASPCCSRKTAGTYLLTWS